jgi:hypothetical protein
VHSMGLGGTNQRIKGGAHSTESRGRHSPWAEPTRQNTLQTDGSVQRRGPGQYDQQHGSVAARHGRGSVAWAPEHAHLAPKTLKTAWTAGTSPAWSPRPGHRSHSEPEGHRDVDSQYHEGKNRSDVRGSPGMHESLTRERSAPTTPPWGVSNEAASHSPRPTLEASRSVHTRPAATRPASAGALSGSGAVLTLEPEGGGSSSSRGPLPTADHPGRDPQSSGHPLRNDGPGTWAGLRSDAKFHHWTASPIKSQLPRSHKGARQAYNTQEQQQPAQVAWREPEEPTQQQPDGYTLSQSNHYRRRTEEVATSIAARETSLVQRRQQRATAESSMQVAGVESGRDVRSCVARCCSTEMHSRECVCVCRRPTPPKSTTASRRRRARSAPGTPPRANVWLLQSVSSLRTSGGRGCTGVVSACLATPSVTARTCARTHHAALSSPLSSEWRAPVDRGGGGNQLRSSPQSSRRRTGTALFAGI